LKIESANEHYNPEKYIHLHVYTRYTGKLIEAKQTILVTIRGKEERAIWGRDANRAFGGKGTEPEEGLMGLSWPISDRNFGTLCVGLRHGLPAGFMLVSILSRCERV
jgi:hypothetical protein